MLVVTLPFLFPSVVALDINPIWFGIVLVKLIEIAVITPPVGFNIFAVMCLLNMILINKIGASTSPRESGKFT